MTGDRCWNEGVEIEKKLGPTEIKFLDLFENKKSNGEDLKKSMIF